MPYTSGLTISKLRERIRAVNSPGFRAELSQVLAAAAGKLVADEFRSSTDPYGKPWAPLVARKGQPLLDTGRMRASFTATPTGNGFRIDATAAYAKFHQYGTRAHQRKGGALPQSRKGRFITKAQAAKAKRSVRVAIVAPFEHGGIPRRQMLPMESTGGMPTAWVRVFQRDTAALIKRRMGAR